MARRNSEHPGVRLFQKADNGTFYLDWRDKRDRSKDQPSGRRRNDSAETNDLLEAKRMALSLARYLKDPKAPNLHKRIRRLVGADLAEQSVIKAHLAVADAVASKGRDPFEQLELLTSELAKAFHCTPEKSISVIIEKVRDCFGKNVPITIQSDDVYTLLSSMLEVSQSRDAWQERSRHLEGMLRVKGKRFVLNTEPLALSDAVEKFMNAPDGTSAKGKWREKIEQRLKRMAREIGEKKNVHDLTTNQIIEHIWPMQVAATTKESITTYACLFMKWATNGQFDTDTVRSAIIDNLEYESAEWFWLTRVEALKLIAQVRENEGDYWADAAAIQYGCGFRPEELPLLRREAATFNGKTAIRIAPIFDDKGRLVRRVKTEKAEDTIQVPSFTVDALTRRVNAGEYLLFPMMDVKWIAPRFWRNERQRDIRTEFERERKLWPEPDESEFTTRYRPILRKAADDIAGEYMKADQKEAAQRFAKENIDSRTFRRTCAREIILAHGFERAAAVLRDSVETLRKHYADLQAADISTER